MRRNPRRLVRSPGIFIVLLLTWSALGTLVHAQALTVSPTTLDFEDVVLGQSKTLEVTITNDGEQDRDVAEIEVSPSGTAFSADPTFTWSDPAITLSPGESTTVTVTFAPVKPGFVSASVRIWDQNENLYTVNLYGTGVITASPESLEFGTVTVGSSKVLTLTVTNPSPSDSVQVESFYAYDDDSEESLDYFADPENFLLLAGESRDVQISFAPAAEGVQEGTLYMYFRSPSGGPWAALHIPVSGEGAYPDLQTVPPSVDFGETQVGESSTQFITLRNSGPVALEVTSISIEGNDAAAFQVNDQQFTLTAGDERLVQVDFVPTSTGTKNADLVILSNDPEGQHRVGLSGEGVILQLAVTPAELDFGEVVVGQSKDAELVLSNTGTGTITVSDMQFTGGGAGAFSVDATTFSLGSQASRTLTVTFAPTAGGPVSATLVIESNAGAQEVSLSGQALAGSLVVSPEALAFGDVPVGASATLALELTNDGVTALTIERISLQDQTGFFQITEGGEVSELAAGASHPVVVAYEPGQEEEHTAVLSIESNDPDQPRREVLLSGRGVRALVVSEQALDFGAVRVGQSAFLALNITNQTGEPMSVSLSVDGSADFTVGGETSFELPAGETRELDVAFVPSERGEQAATLTLAGSGAVSAELTVALSGQGVAPQAQLSATALDFGEVTVGRTVTLTLELANVGDEELSVSDLTVVGLDAALFTVDDPGAFSLAPEASRGLAVSFSPSSSGGKTASLRIASDDPVQPQLEVALSGSGAAITNESPDQGDENTLAEVAFSLPGDFQPTSARLFYRMGGRRTYEIIDLGADGNRFETAIPAEAMTLRGVQYYAEFIQGEQVVTVPVDNPVEQPEQIRVRVNTVSADEIAAFLPLAAERYAMVSVPLELEDPGVASVLGDDYGEYDPSRWRVLRWRSAVESYAEPPELGAGFVAGQAFWLITRDGQGFDADEGLSTDLSQPFVITVPPGYSQIGNPFAFPVSVSDIAASGSLQGPHGYDGTQYLLNRSVLEPWQGYFVFNPGSEPVTLTIPPMEAGQVAGKLEGEDFPWPGAAFAVQMMAELPEHGLRDTYNAVGFASEPVTGWRTLDVLEPPPIGEHVQLSVVEGDRRYASRFALEPENGASWDLELTATPAEVGTEEVRVTLVEHGRRPPGFALYVLDRDEGRVLSLEAAGFSVQLSPERPRRHLRLIMGTESFAEARAEGASLVPVTFALEQNYPNPFNPETVIRYSLSQESPVQLEVFNVLGQRVRTLVDERQQTGHYAVTWDGRDEGGREVASGVYVYRLRAGSFTASRTMMLVR